MSSRHLASPCLLAVLVPACADPCLDDGLIQEDRGSDCPVLADDDGSSSEASTSSSTSTSTSSEVGTTSSVTTSDGTTTDGTTTGGTTTGGTEVVACIDVDGDGRGDPEACEGVLEGEPPPPGTVPNGEDCADDDPNAFVGAAPLDDASACMLDADGDGYGTATPPPGVEAGTDCADDDPEIPAITPCDTVRCIDGDGDGFGDPTRCMDGLPGDYVDNGEDCSDADAAVHPGAAVREPDLCTVDRDGDGFGDSAAPASAPEADAGSDCDDADAYLRPGAEHEPGLCTFDADGDGFGDEQAEDRNPAAENGTDCADDRADIFPGAATLEPQLCTLDGDGDGLGDLDAQSEHPNADNGSDCDDASAVVSACLAVDAGTCVTASSEGAQLLATASGGTGSYTYAWTPTDGLTASDAANPIASVPDLASYAVTVDDGTTTATDTVTVTVDTPYGLQTRCELIALDLTVEAAPELTFDPTGTQVCTSGGDVGLHLCDVHIQGTRLEGMLRVNDFDDDDNIGFVWGAQDASHFYYFTWKRTSQSQPSAPDPVCPDGGENVWPGGMLVKRIDSPSADELTLPDLLCNFDTDRATVVLGPEDLTTEGWTFGIDYVVTLDITAATTEVSISRESDGEEIQAFTVVGDGAGRFGTLTVSQPGACYGPWHAACVVP